jgi:hypothetical protein
MPSTVSTLGKFIPIIKKYSSDARFTMSLTDKDTGEAFETYTFYVTPDQITIQTPGRVQVYQTARGSAHIDHMGAGLATVVITGQTGMSPLTPGAPTGLYQYRLLRKMIEKYFDLCEAAIGPNSVALILSVSFPDNPFFGRWPVAVKDFTLSRSADKPMHNRYALTMIIVGRNSYSPSRPNAKRSDPNTAAATTVAARAASQNALNKAIPDEWFNYTVPFGADPEQNGNHQDNPLTLMEIIATVYPSLVSGLAEGGSAAPLGKYVTDLQARNGIANPYAKIPSGTVLYLYKFLNRTSQSQEAATSLQTPGYD